MNLAIVPIVAALLVALVCWNIWNDNRGWHRCRKCGAYGRHPLTATNFYYFTYRCTRCGEEFHIG
jgi:hypothetical protein